jgi:hypothetical protein
MDEDYKLFPSYAFIAQCFVKYRDNIWSAIISLFISFIINKKILETVAKGKYLQAVFIWL